MSKSVFIGVMALALVVVGAIAYTSSRDRGGNNGQDNRMFLQQEDGRSSDMSERVRPPDGIGRDQSERNVVTYTNQGFNPKTLTVKKGETVRFDNQSGEPMWVASAPHPEHTDYPEFDAKRGIPSGESYEFTFEQVGSWKFHNHLNPTAFGSITVTE